MASLINVKELYNEVAVATGFPTYTNDTDTPDITRFLLEMISEGLHSTLDLISTNANTVQRENRIITIPGQDKYSVDGIVKHLELIDDRGRIHRIPYNDMADPMRTLDKKVDKGMPRSYVISGGYIKLMPIPEKKYELRAVLSSSDLVLSNNDTYKNRVTDIEDVIIGTQDFATCVKMRTIALLLMRCMSPQAQIYSGLSIERVKSYIEKDIGSVEGNRGMRRSGGHYDVRRGLLDY
ncbi:MAG: hypothetical protein NC218_08220 [Acetobacter sp.]|nr:hypothetical protein [Acetobacter sp.]